MDKDRTILSLVAERLGDPASEPLGGAGPLLLKRLPPAHLPPNAVRIKVAAAALNFADSLTIQGHYQEKPPLPFVPGNECSGVVIEAGHDVRTLSVGDHVVAVTQGGAFAEEVIVRETSAVKLPKGCDLEAAAGLPVAFGTAYLALRDRARLRQGQTVLVLGAGGGVGLAAVQLARTMGARVVAVARGASKASVLKDAGADVVVDPSALPHGGGPGALKSAVLRAAPGGIDVVFDPVGGALFSEALRCARWGAHILVIGFASGKIPSLQNNIVLVKNLTVHGVYWGSYQNHEPATFRHSLEACVALLAAGDLRVHVPHRYALDQVQEAFQVLGKREVVGKLLMCPGPRSMSIRSMM